MKTFRLRHAVVFVAVMIAAACYMVTPGYASIYGFNHIVEATDGLTEEGDGAIGEAQLTVEVTDIGSNQALFTFANSGPEASSIADVYFDDGTLITLNSLIDADDNDGDLGVDFSPGANPSELPGGMNVVPAFETTNTFLTDSDAPAQPNGVNPGETLGVIFDLQSGTTFADLLDAIELGLTLDASSTQADIDDSLRIGIHVQGFASGGSEAFINGGPVIPEPASIAVWTLMTLAGVGVVGHRRRQ